MAFWAILENITFYVKPAVTIFWAALEPFGLPLIPTSGYTARHVRKGTWKVDTGCLGRNIKLLKISHLPFVMYKQFDKIYCSDYVDRRQ